MDTTHIRLAVERLANCSMELSLEEWGFISNVMLAAADKIDTMRDLLERAKGRGDVHFDREISETLEQH